MKIIKIFLISIVFLFSSSTLFAQTFGFGCLGLSGVFAGYGAQFYKADGLNDALTNMYSAYPNASGKYKFEEGTGFRFGANILRANFDNFFISAKGFYQFSKEEHTVQYSAGIDNKYENQLTLTSDHWGFGIDFGFPLFKFVDFKIIEGGVTFYNVSFENKELLNGVEKSTKSYSSDETKIGYYVATGFIIDVIKGYMSIEGSAIYNFSKIEDLSSDQNEYFPQKSVGKALIENGGFAAAVQLNIGFPL